MAEYPLVSVVMPAYNCEKFVGRAIESVLSQTYPYWELVVGDDGSKDNTRSIINSYRDTRIIKLHNEENQGNIRTRNKLFSATSGAYLTVLDADDWIASDKLKIQLDAFKTHQQIGACVTNYYEVGVEGKLGLSQHVRENFYLDINRFEQIYQYPAASIMLKREIYEKVGGLNLYFDRLFGEDKYWIYLILENQDILFIKEPLYFYRANPLSITNHVDNERKLTIISLIEELLRQRREKGYDWLSLGCTDKALAFESNLLKQKAWIAERYRVRAARCIDLLQLNRAFRFLVKAVVSNPINIKNIRTFFYLLRSINKYSS